MRSNWYALLNKTHAQQINMFSKPFHKQDIIYVYTYIYKRVNIVAPQLNFLIYRERTPQPGLELIVIHIDTVLFARCPNLFCHDINANCLASNKLPSTHTPKFQGGGNTI